MLLPRPEISTPTRLALRIVGRGPIPGGIPAAGLACDRAAALPGFDPADPGHGLAGVFEGCGDLVGLIGRNDDRHADAAVECPRHLLRSDLSCVLQQSEDLRVFPTVNFYDSMAVSGQNPWNILEKSATGDVRKTLDPPLLDERQERTDVDACRLEQSFGEGAPVQRRKRLVQCPFLTLDDLPNQREAVAVHPRAGEAQDDVTRRDVGPR